MRIGVFGGSFNPVHNGHIAVAQRVKDEFGLDKVIFVVAADPPHKTIARGVMPELRLALTQLALLDAEGLEASDVELKRGGKSYTIDTLKSLGEAHMASEMFFILGADMLYTLPSWYEAEALMHTARFIAVSRPESNCNARDVAKALKTRYGADVSVSTFTGPDISSSGVREAVYRAKPVGSLTTAPVETAIYENLLYLPDDIADIGGELRKTLKPSLFAHTMGTVIAAVELADAFGADGEKARLAALLHDSAKFDIERQLELARAYNVDAAAFASPKLLHGPLAALCARERYGVDDAEVLSALTHHTIPVPEMTDVEKIVFLADKIERGRSYDGVEKIRRAAKTSLDAAMLLCIDQTVEFIRGTRGAKLDESVLTVRDYLRNKIKTEEALD